MQRSLMLRAQILNKVQIPDINSYMSLGNCLINNPLIKKF